MHALAAVQETAFRLPTPFGVVGVLCIFHAEPFHRSARAVSVEDAPTAKHATEDGQDTAFRAPPPLGFRVGWIDQLEASAGAADAAAIPSARIAVAHAVMIRRVHRRTGSGSQTRFATPDDFRRFALVGI